MAPTIRTKKQKEPPTSWYSCLDAIEIWMELILFNALDDATGRSAQETINNYVRNQQNENVSDHDIYEGVADLFPDFGNPHEWFLNYYLKESEIGKAA